ncbi:type II toxin-antitoxin system death-on-curing family toxin [Minwuia sp.]|uniref:type II toxin-antitoxin system death-on-curing family toxin n=1 Tax=Minwuia sp. TaxID=2493630 RepID=UPI003A8F108A
MIDWIWIEPATIKAIHEEQIREHGGIEGIRDQGLLEAALARPQQIAAYGSDDVVDLVSGYVYGIARNHAFLDGNKRTAFVAGELFLVLNGYELVADDVDAVTTMLRVADGTLDEEDFQEWLRERVVRNDA